MYIIFFILLTFSAESNLCAQWKKVANNLFFNDGYGGSNIYGVLAFKDGTLLGGTRNLMLSLDTGQTWKTVLTTPSGNAVACIDFFDSANVLMVTNQYLYISSDRGNTWSSQAFTNASAACFAGSLSHIVLATYYAMYVSTDGGVTFTKTHDAPLLSFPITYVKYRSNGLVIALEDHHLIVSTDYGSTWTASNKYLNVPKTDSWTFTFSPCDSSNQLLVANENGFGALGSMFSTTDNGTTWQTMFQRTSPFLNGCITAYGNSLFLETVVGNLLNFQGVFRSTDRGVTWDSIGGPSTYHQDSRMLAPINNNTILAIDNNGNLWRTDSAGGKPVVSPPPFFTKPKPISVNECRKDSSQIIITGLSCHRYHITAAQLIGTDISSLQLKGNLPPLILSDTVKDTIGIIFRSQNLYGVLQDSIKITWYDEGEGKIHDTTIAIPLTVNPLPPDLRASVTSVQFDSASLCMSRDTVIRLRNFGCDTLQIYSGPGTLAQTFSADPLFLPIFLPPDSSLSVHIHFHSPVAGSFSTTALFGAEHRGLLQQITIPVTALSFGPNAGLTFKDSLIVLIPVSTCIPKRDSNITLINTGCDTIRITSGPNGLTSGFSADPLTLPFMILPGDSLRITIHFNPPSVGKFQTNASFTGDLGGFTQVRNFSLAGENIGSKPGLASQDTLVDFHNVSLCNSSRDTLIQLINRGCDTLTLLTGPGNLANGFSADPLLLPIKIAPDSAITIRYHFHPSASFHYQATANFTATANGLNQQVTQSLSGNGVAGASGPVVLQSSFILDTLSICGAIADTTVYFTNRGCDTLLVTNGPGPLNTGFTTDLLSLPLSIAPGDSAAIIFHFSPPAIGIFRRSVL